MKISELMKKDVATCSPRDSMERATAIMWEHDCGWVPVVDEEKKVLGVITDRDVAMAAGSRDRPLRAMAVAQAMSGGALCCSSEDELSVALRTLSEGRFHRVPVVDEKEHLVGVLSMADVVQEAGRAKPADRKKWAEDVLATLVEVTRPRAMETTRAVEKPFKPLG